MSRILVFENTLHDQEFLQNCLENRFETHIFSDARNCIEKTLEIAPDLILMDLALDSINVLEARTQLRKHRTTANIPVLLISTLQEVEKKRAALSSDRNDFVFKPLQEKDLLQHIEFRLNGAKDIDGCSGHLSAGDLAIDLNLKNVYLGSPKLKLKNRLQIGLSEVELTLLTYFMKHEGRIFSRADIHEYLEHSAQQENANALPRIVDGLVFQLRKKLKPVAHYFQTVYGRGYRFSVCSSPRRLT